MKTKFRLNKVVVISIIAFIVITIISVLFVYLNYYGVFDKEPKVEIEPNNTYSETLYVATDYDYKPFSYIENGEYAGLDVELIIEVANRLNMNLDLVLLDWNDAQKGLIDGKYDVILNMESNAVLKDDRIIGTIPTDEKQYVVYGKNKVNYVGELYGMRVAAYNKFDELGMDVITGYSYQEMFEKLLSDELDYIICPIQVGDSFVEKLNARNTIVSSYQVSYMYGCMALKTGDEELCAKLNEVVKELQVEGFIKKLDNKWVTRRYGSTSIKDFLEDNPMLVTIFVVGIQLVAIGMILFIFISISSQRNKAYAEELQKNINIINEQNENLKIANERAQAANKAKTNFLFNMSHDIRTPMNAIIGFTNLAEKHIDEKETIKDYLSKINASSNILLGLINDILEMARIESGKTQLNLAPENIVEIMDQIDSIMRVQADSKNQELIVEKHVNHLYVLCDKLKLNQVMINLISNAIKYTDNDGHIKVSLDETDSLDKDKARYIIKVKDDGMGMSDEFQKKIFEPFEREKSTTVSKITGTGLGMSITKSLVELMNGDISLVSTLGEGSEFIVTIDFDIAQEPEKVEKEIVETSQNVSVDKVHTILVVDDNEINRLIVSEILHDMGYETIEACDGEEAVEIAKNAKENDFSMILMDVQMPVLNGYEATKIIRSLDSPISKLPIIALTANAFEDDKINAEKAGMNGHIAKPIDIDLLKKTLKDFSI